MCRGSHAAYDDPRLWGLSVQLSRPIRLAAAGDRCRNLMQPAAQLLGSFIRQTRHVAADPVYQGRVAGAAAVETRGAGLTAERAQAHP